jgi:hypothetical protein
MHNSCKEQRSNSNPPRRSRTARLLLIGGGEILHKRMLIPPLVRLIDNPPQPAISASSQSILIFLAQLCNPLITLALLNSFDSGEVINHLAIRNIRHHRRSIIWLSRQMWQVAAPDIYGPQDEQHDAENDETGDAAEEEFVLDLARAVG